MRILSSNPMRGALALLCLAAAGMSPAEPGVSLVVGVWDGVGAVPGTFVSASSESGPIKGVLQPGGQFLMHDVGTLTPDGIKLTVEVVHPVFGVELVDALYVPDTNLRLDVQFDAHGGVQTFSPDFAPGVIPTDPGDGAGNDLCANATAVGLPSSTAGTTVGATFDAVATCVTSNTAPGVWYTVVGNGQTVTATTCGAAGFDSKISVFCGGCGALTCITGNDDNCAAGPSGLLSTVSWCAQAGATYHILVHGFGTAVGPFTLNVSANGASCTPTVNCIPAEPTGGCCFEDGSCAVLTANECDALGGNYQGDDAPCFGLPGAGNNYATNPNAAIPDNNLVGLNSVINVPDALTIGDVNVTLNVSHTWTGDLKATLTHGATSVVLVDRPGVPATTFGCDQDNWVGLVLDDEAANPVENGCVANLGGLFTPEQALSAFDGADSAGVWTLNISDAAAADIGTLVSWSINVATAGDPVCVPAECFLVVGDDQGHDPFVGAGHGFQTQVGDIADSFIVWMTDVPEFVLPMPITTRGHATSGTGGLMGTAAPHIDLSGSPEWMQDGEFAVQVVMWNPVVFPGMPEQFTAGLLVQIKPNGHVVTSPYGNNVGGLQVWHEIGRNEDGQPVIRFPFSIPGF